MPVDCCEIAFPLPQGIREAPSPPDEEDVLGNDRHQESSTFGLEAKAEKRAEIRARILRAQAATPPDFVTIALAWEDSLCRDHPSMLDVQEIVGRAISEAGPIRSLQEAIDRRDAEAVVQLWSPTMKGISHMSAGRRAILRDIVAERILCNIPLRPHSMTPVVRSHRSIEVRWIYPRPYKWLFAVAVRNERHPESLDDIAADHHACVRTATQCAAGVRVPFGEARPHVCVWPAILVGGEVAVGPEPLRLTHENETAGVGARSWRV